MIRIFIFSCHSKASYNIEGVWDAFCTFFTTVRRKYNIRTSFQTILYFLSYIRVSRFRSFESLVLLCFILFFYFRLFLFHPFTSSLSLPLSFSFSSALSSVSFFSKTPTWSVLYIPVQWYQSKQYFVLTMTFASTKMYTATITRQCLIIRLIIRLKSSDKIELPGMWLDSDPDMDDSEPKHFLIHWICRNDLKEGYNNAYMHAAEQVLWTEIYRLWWLLEAVIVLL